MAKKGQKLTKKAKRLCARKPRSRSWDALMDEEQRRLIKVALDETDGNITRIVDLVGLERVYLMQLLKRLGLSEYARELRRQRWNRPSGFGRPPVLNGSR